MPRVDSHDAREQRRRNAADPERARMRGIEIELRGTDLTDERRRELQAVLDAWRAARIAAKVRARAAEAS